MKDLKLPPSKLVTLLETMSMEELIEALNTNKDVLISAFTTVVQKQSELILGEITSIKTDIATLKTDVTTIKTDVSTLKIDVAELRTDVSTLKTDIAEIKRILLNQNK